MMRQVVSGVLISLLIVLVSVSFADTVSARSSALIIPIDQLTQPGQPTYLEVRLRTGGFSFIQRPISGELVEFLIGDQVIGRSLASGRGIAVRKFTPTEPGLYVVTVRLVENPRYEAESVELIVACRKHSDPILLIHLSSVKDPADPPEIPFLPSPIQEAMPEAARILTELSKTRQLLYFDSGKEKLLPEQKIWMVDEDFPQAPLMAWDLSGGASAHTDRLTDRLDALKAEGWKNLSAGISRSALDAEVFIAQGIRAIVMAEEGDDPELPEGVGVVTNWTEIPAALRPH